MTARLDAGTSARTRDCRPRSKSSRRPSASRAASPRVCGPSIPSEITADLARPGFEARDRALRVFGWDTQRSHALAHEGARAMDAIDRRALADTEHLGDLGHRQALPVIELERDLLI